MTCPVLHEILNSKVVALIPVSGHAFSLKLHREAEAWVWTYLAACLATGVGYDEARAVVEIVVGQRSREPVEVV